MSSAWSWATLLASVGCGLMAGVFFAFSGFVMAGLKRLPAAHAVAAMNAINRTAVLPPLMIALLGTAALCAGLGVWALLDWGDGRTAPTVAGAVLYLLGAIGVTRAANVPLNDRLAEVDPRGAGAADEWNRYLGAWTAWNHVRGALTGAAAALLAIALASE
jgi:uncharacterized membrane protein